MSPSKTAKKKAGTTPARPKKEATRKEVHSLEPVDTPAVGQSNGQPQSQQQEGRYVYGVIEARDSVRSEERRVGKECRSRWWAERERKKLKVKRERRTGAVERA